MRWSKSWMAKPRSRFWQYIRPENRRFRFHAGKPASRPSGDQIIQNALDDGQDLNDWSAGFILLLYGMKDLTYFSIDLKHYLSAHSRSSHPVSASAEASLTAKDFFPPASARMSLMFNSK